MNIMLSKAADSAAVLVALHRAAYLLYTYRKRLARRGILVIGPSTTFLRYVVSSNLVAAGQRVAHGHELVPGSGRLAGRSKPRKASGVRKAVISWICSPRRVSTSTARGVNGCVVASPA